MAGYFGLPTLKQLHRENNLSLPIGEIKKVEYSNFTFPFYKRIIGKLMKREDSKKPPFHKKIIRNLIGDYGKNYVWFLNTEACFDHEASDSVRTPANFVDPYGRWALVEGKIIEPKNFRKHNIYV